MKKRFCTKCGKEINFDAEFCPFCGTKQPPLQNNQESNNIPISTNPGLINSTKQFWDNLISIDNRMTRADFWWSYLGNIIISTIVFLIGAIIAGFIQFLNFPMLLIIATIFGLISIGSFTASIRRLHDTERNGWLLLLGLIPLVGAIILLVFYCQPSKSNSSRFKSNKNKIWYKTWWVWFIAIIFGLVIAIDSSQSDSESTSDSSEKNEITTSSSNGKYYSVKLTSVKTKEDEWLISGTTNAPNNARVIAVSSDSSTQELENNDVEAPSVHNGKFSGHISGISFEDDSKVGDKTTVYIVATSKNILSKDRYEVKNKYLTNLTTDKFKQSLTFTKNQLKEINDDGEGETDSEDHPSSSSSKESSSKSAVSSKKTNKDTEAINNANTLSYGELLKSDKYSGKQYALNSARVIQAEEDDDGSTVLLAYINDDSDDLFAIKYDGTTKAVEDSIINVKGELGDRINYDTQIGGSNTVPSLIARSIDVIG